AIHRSGASRGDKSLGSGASNCCEVAILQLVKTPRDYCMLTYRWTIKLVARSSYLLFIDHRRWLHYANFSHLQLGGIETRGTHHEGAITFASVRFRDGRR